MSTAYKLYGVLSTTSINHSSRPISSCDRAHQLEWLKIGPLQITLHLASTAVAEPLNPLEYLAMRQPTY